MSQALLGDGGRAVGLAAGPAPDGRISGRGTTDGFSPAKVIAVELTERLPRLDFGGQYGRAWVLARLHTEPVGVCVAPLMAAGISPDQLATLLWSELGERVAARFAAAGLTKPARLTGEGLRADPAAWPFLRRRAALLAHAPFISVIICTRDRPAELRNCLARLELQEYPRFEVIVVDNAASTDDVRNLIKHYAGRSTEFHYIAESRPGLSWARNAGVAAATGEIIAFLDDDDEPDKHWLAGIADGFARSDRIGCVTGLILPARLDTAAEQLFQLVCGHGKARGFAPETFSRSGPQSPLFPLPPFGTGANMAFRREVIDNFGGFDVALGAGTRTAAGEDTLALTLTLLAGHEIAYEPAALMWHHHRRDMDGLNRQLHGYSVGLTAFYAALLRHRPGVLPGLLKLLPAALTYMRDSTSAPEDQSALLKTLNRRHVQGMLKGPFAYAGSLRQQRRAASLRPAPPGAHDHT